MPAKLNMHISNGNPSPAQIRAFTAASSAPVIKPPSTLNSGMITRIHNVKPGCGGCGRG
jgi:hypothetical protein